MKQTLVAELWCIGRCGPTDVVRKVTFDLDRTQDSALALALSHTSALKRTLQAFHCSTTDRINIPLLGEGTN